MCARPGQGRPFHVSRLRYIIGGNNRRNDDGCSNIDAARPCERQAQGRRGGKACSLRLDRLGCRARILLTRVADESALPAGLTADPEAYDAWFRAKVREALVDMQPAVPHHQVMDETQALIDKKRRACA